MIDYSVGVIGNGPSAVVLSYILDGNVPFYDPSVFGPHPDAMLHELLSSFVYQDQESLSLLDAVKDNELLAYVESYYHSFYSATMLPINLLIDTLVCSDETEFASFKCKQSRISWHKIRPAISHIILGSSSTAGGQWSSDHPETDDPDEKTLSYAEMLSLPVQSFSMFYKQRFGQQPEDFYRPSRKEVAAYLADYPHRMGIAQHIKSNTIVSCVDKDSDGNFDIAYVKDDTQCTVKVKKLVLASGVFDVPSTTKHHTRQKPTFSKLVRVMTNGSSCFSYTMAPPLSTPPLDDDDGCVPAGPSTTLVLGSGVSAAEAVNKGSRGSSIIHIYKWNKASSTSSNPLKRFPKELYPEYYKVYKSMKTGGKLGDYEGLPNATVSDVSPDGVVDIKLENGDIVSRKVNMIKVRTGRCGSLDFLSPDILDLPRLDRISRDTFRKQMQGSEPNLEVSPNVYAIGSLTGDTLVRFLLGGSFWVAGELQ